MEEKSAIAEWFRRKSILITGGTGFMGKVLVEKLLFSCNDISTIYIMTRQKLKASQQENLRNIWTQPVFDRISRSKPYLLDKVVFISADIALDSLGLTQKDKQKLINNVSVVFHFASTSTTEVNLKEAIEVNVSGTQRLLDLSKEMKNSATFIHLSTTFCSSDLDIFEEKIHELTTDVEKIMSMVKWINSEALISITPEMITPHPSTYLYSKRLAENVVCGAKNVRVAIIRPSIVGPSLSEPIAGWVDTLSGPMGIIAALGKGILRTMYGVNNGNAHFIPVDVAVNVAIVVAWKLGTSSSQSEDVPVYNLTCDPFLRISWPQMLNIFKKTIHDYPVPNQLWYPSGVVHTNYNSYYIRSLFVHWLPAILIDLLMILTSQKKHMLRTQRKLYIAIRQFNFYTSTKWIFENRNFLNLSKNLNNVDKQIYKTELVNFVLEEYIEKCVLGMRQYCLHEDSTSLERCRKVQKGLFLLHVISQLALIYITIRALYSCSDTVKSVVDTLRYSAKVLPMLVKGYLQQVSLDN